MSSIYAIRDDGIKFKELDLELPDLFGLKPNHVSLDDLLEFHTRNTRMSSWWKPLDVTFEARPANPKGSIPDLCGWIDATLVLSPRAFRMLGELLEPHGEFLPVSVEGETFRIFNCFTTVKADEEGSEHEHEGEMQLGLKRLELREDAQETLIFKVPLESCLTLYCNDRFKSAVEDFGLTGVIFDSNLLITSPFNSQKDEA